VAFAILLAVAGPVAASCGEPEALGERIEAVEGVGLDVVGAVEHRVAAVSLAILADPDLAERRRELAPQHLEDGPHPPMYLAAYLSEEQKLGRIRGDVDCVQAAMMLLASMFGLAMMPGAEGPGIGLVEPMVNLFLTGMAP
jgi:hypothetical protein